MKIIKNNVSKNDKETLPYIKLLIKQKSLNDSWDDHVNYLGGILSPKVFNNFAN